LVFEDSVKKSKKFQTFHTIIMQLFLPLKIEKFEEIDFSEKFIYLFY